MTKLRIANPRGSKTRRANPPRRRTSAARKRTTTRRRRRRKNPALPGPVVAMAGALIGGGIGGAAVAGARHLGLGSPAVRGGAAIAAGLIAGGAIGMVSPAAGAGVGGGLAGAGLIDIVGALTPKATGETTTSGIGRVRMLSPRVGDRPALVPAVQPRALQQRPMSPIDARSELSGVTFDNLSGVTFDSLGAVRSEVDSALSMGSDGSVWIGKLRVA